MHDTVRMASESVRISKDIDKVFTGKTAREQGIARGIDLAPIEPGASLLSLPCALM
jgi:hypothetical protein